MSIQPATHELTHQTTAAILDGLESRYVESLNAVLASYDNDSPDAHRWRGHAEAYRQADALVREVIGAEPIDMTSTAWRKDNGVYQPEYLTALRSRSPETGQEPIRDADKKHHAHVRETTRTKLNNPPAAGAPQDWRWGYLPCGCCNDGHGRHTR